MYSVPQDIACGEDRRFGHLAGLQVRCCGFNSTRSLEAISLERMLAKSSGIVDMAVQCLGDVPFIEGGALVAEVVSG